MFEYGGSAGRSPLADWTLALLPLLAAAAVTTLLDVALEPRRFALPSAFLRAVAYVLAAFAASVIAGRAAFVVFRPDLRASPWAITLCFAGFGVWFGPLSIAASHDYPGSSVVTGIAAVGLARILGRFEKVVVNREGNDSEAHALSIEMFQGSMPAPSSPYRLQAYIAAVLIQVGIAATITGWSHPAALAIALACFMVAWAARDARPAEANFYLSPRFKIGMVASLLMVVAVNTLMLLSFHSKTGSAGAGLSASSSGKDTYSGVILLAEPQRRTALLAPRPSQPQTSFVRMDSGDPVSFPFSGEYWFFRWPHRPPSEDSMISTGSPLSYTFTNIDHKALVMWARQPLNPAIPASCCSAIDVAVSSTDPKPGALFLELILVENEPGQQGKSQSLGSLRLNFDSAAAARTEAKPYTERLRFRLPKRPAIRKADEIRMLFHLEMPRTHRSANVAIDRFYLIAHGL